MRARARSLGIFLTIIFLSLVLYTGFELYQLPNNIVNVIGDDNRSKVDRARQILSKTDKITIHQKLQEVEETLKRPNTQGGNRLQQAKEASYSVYIAFGFMLIAGLLLMFLLLAASYRTSSGTIVYVEKKEEDSQSEDNSGKSQKELLHEIEQHVVHLINTEDQLLQEQFDEFLQIICDRLQAGSGILYTVKTNKNQRFISLKSGYAYVMPDSGELSYEFGEGLAGQVAKTQRPIQTSSLPKGYAKVFSGLGESNPPYLTIMPILKNNQTLGVFEVSTFQAIDSNDYQKLESLFSQLADKFES